MASNRLAEEAPAHARVVVEPVEVRLRERVRAFEEAIQRTAGAEDGDAIHDLRVAARRLIGFLRTWRTLINGGGFRKLVRGLRALRRRAGRARDIEVQVETLRARLEDHGAPDSGALDLLRDLEARLERRRRRVGKRARAQKTRRLLARLARAVQGMSGDLPSHLEAFEAAHARERDRRLATLDAVRTSLESSEDIELHQARIAIKKWRYALESLGESEGWIGIMLGAVRPLQEALGGILDRAGLRGLLAEQLGEPGHDGAQRTLPSLMSDLDAERAEQLQRYRALAGDFLRSVEAPP